MLRREQDGCEARSEMVLLYGVLGLRDHGELLCVIVHESIKP